MCIKDYAGYDGPRGIVVVNYLVIGGNYITKNMLLGVTVMNIISKNEHFEEVVLLVSSQHIIAIEL